MGELKKALAIRPKEKPRSGWGEESGASDRMLAEVGASTAAITPQYDDAEMTSQALALSHKHTVTPISHERTRPRPSGGQSPVIKILSN